MVKQCKRVQLSLGFVLKLVSDGASECVLLVGVLLLVSFLGPLCWFPVLVSFDGFLVWFPFGFHVLVCFFGFFYFTELEGETGGSMECPLCPVPGVPAHGSDT